MRQTLVVMVKEPRPGRVKTRLGRDIGHVAAAWWFRHQVTGLLRRLRDPRWDLVLAVSPDRAGVLSRVWPSDLPRIAQGRGDLGDRMARVFCAASSGPTCIIGADIPGIDRHRVARAFGKLRGADAVFGPAEDGGYWLIGLNVVRARPPGFSFLRDVRWSTEHALADTVAGLADHRVAYADRLQDVDTVADLAMTSRIARDTTRS